MRSHRGSWLNPSILAAALVLVPAATTVRAQPGFGPDPFWPYNSQYTPYVTPIGPSGPPGNQGGTLNSREGIRGANQFQEYLDDLRGPGRNVSDRSNVGMPYYRSAVDPSYETQGRGPRQYMPNAKASETFEEAERRVEDLYFRYYSERDPARRAALLKEYRAARREAALAVSGRGRSPSRLLDSSARRGSASGRGARSGSAAARLGGTDRTRALADRDGFGPPPEVPTIGTRRSSGSGPRPRRTLPTDVLDRSRAMDRAMDRLDALLRDPDSPGPSSRSRGRAPARPSPTLPDAGNNNP